MRATTLFFPLAFALTSVADASSSNKLDARLNLSIGPDTVCGDNSVDCNNGFCCSEGSKCDTSGTITKCGNDPALPYDLGSVGSAIGSKIENLPSSIFAEASSFLGALPTSILAEVSSFISDKNIPTGDLSSFYNAIPTSLRGQASSFINGLPTELGLGSPTQTPGADSGAPQGAEGTGGAMGASATFGNTAALIAGIWGVAALGGAGWLFL